MSAACPECGEPLETPLVCGACGSLLEPAADATPFDSLGLAPAWDVDAADLRKRWLRFSRLVHPDYFGGAGPDLRARAEHHSAELNRAHELLANDRKRASWLLDSLGGPDESEERQMPQEFLMEVMEWNEALEEARAAAPDSPARAALGPLGDELRARRAACLERVGADLTPLPEAASVDRDVLVGIRKNLNAVRYVDRALAEMEALRLEQASTR